MKRMFFHSVIHTKIATNPNLNLTKSERHCYRNVMLIYKIFRRDEWDSLVKRGETKGAPIDLQDGFIHLSTGDQVVETAQLHFSGASNLVLAALDAGSLGLDLKWETSRGGALFPHLFRKMRLSDVVWSSDLPVVDGYHQFPEVAVPA